jgi:maltokinase
VNPCQAQSLLEARWFAGKARRVTAVSTVERVGPLTVARVAYEDGGAERYLLFERVEWRSLLSSLAVAPLRGSAGGRLELRGSVPLEGLAGERVPSTDQTNTLVALGERVLVKAYRRLEAGVHPEVELLAALGDVTGAPVPRFFGSLHHVGADGSDTAVTLLCEFVARAEGGWEGPIERVAAFLRDEVDEPIAEYRAAGAAASELHAALAVAFPPRAATAEDAAAASEAAAEALAAAAVDADLAAGIGAGLSGLERLEGSPLQRIHSDLHYAQFLRSSGTPLIVDFEGDPTRPLAQRRLPGSPLHDLACLLRSIDHIGSAAARRAGGAAPEGWIARAGDAALAGYGSRVDGTLLHALELAKELGELVYSQRVLPEWAYAPRAGLRRLLAAQGST